MPIYEYICLKCNENFSILQSLYPSDNRTECPKCASDELKKVMSAFSCASGSESGHSSSAPAPSLGGGGG